MPQSTWICNTAKFKNLNYFLYWSYLLITFTHSKIMKSNYSASCLKNGIQWDIHVYVVKTHLLKTKLRSLALLTSLQL